MPAAASVVSSTIRVGEAPGTMRTVSCGSSRITVPTPTMTPSHAARSACDSRRSDSPLIHLESPVDVAMRPSSVWAYFSTTYGRSVRGRTSPSSAIASAGEHRRRRDSRDRVSPVGRTWSRRCALVSR